MKKSLLALAAMGAFTSVAQAQSSVTVYGVIDEGFAGGNTRSSNGTVAVNGAAPNTLTAANGTTGVVKKTGFGVTGAAESTNRIGLRGTEDLGGGLSAFFTYEAKMDVENGGSIGLFSTTRQAFVGLKQNGIGAGSFGAQNTVIYDAVLATAATGVNNVTGSLVDNISATGAAGTAAYQTGLATSSGYNTRINNSLVFKSDRFAGFNVRAMIVASGSDTTQTANGGAAAGTGGVAKVSGQALGLDYTWQKLNLTANYQQFTQSANANAMTTVPIIFGASATGAGGSLATAGTNVRDSGQYYAATYDFGILKAYAQYVNRKAQVDSNPLYFSKFTAQQIGVRSYITPTIEAWAAGSVGKYSSLPVIVTTGTAYTPGQANLAAMQVGANYWLSKRTNLYAIYGQMASSNVALSAIGNTTSANVNNYAVGVRHTF